MGYRFNLSYSFWGFFRKGELDARRYREKVREAVRKDISWLISSEELIEGRDKTNIKISSASFEKPRFRFNPDEQIFVGEGKKSLGLSNKEEKYRRGPAGKKGTEDNGGENFVWLSAEELESLVLEELEFPDVNDRQLHERTKDGNCAYYDICSVGSFGRLDRMRTIKENIKRNSFKNLQKIGYFRKSDFKFKYPVSEKRDEKKAVIFAVLDTSKSMGYEEIYFSKVFYYWVVKYIKEKYRGIEVVFITHDTSACEVKEKEFFSKGKSGGTKFSSAYSLLLDIICARFDTYNHDIYGLHFTDGKNVHTDKYRAAALLKKLLEDRRVYFGYCEIALSDTAESTMIKEYQNLESLPLIKARIRNREDIYKFLCSFFRSGKRKNL